MQRADWLYMDECDYLGDKDFEAIYAITFEAPQRIGTMISSTPTGRRGMFYKICNEMRLNQEVKMSKDNRYDMSTYNRETAEGWQEFYYPTMVNPEWSPKMERELRQQFSEVAYEHEILAEFGTELVGVFNKDYIDEACSVSYPYHDRPMSNAPICIGVDWDKASAATQIVVTQFNSFDPRRSRAEIELEDNGFGRFQVINRIEIPKGEFTYDLAVKRLIELDKIYKPFAIYADAGAGENSPLYIEIYKEYWGKSVKTEMLIPR